MKKALIKSLNDITDTLGIYIVPSVIFGILMMFLIMYVSKSSPMAVVKEWINNFKRNSVFRWQLAFFVYVYLVLSRTIFSRKMNWENTFDKMMNGWLLYNNNGKYGYDAIENYILFIPYMFLFYAAFLDRNIKYGSLEIIKKGFLISFCSTLAIESTQLIFGIGTFQFADLTYNTLGGMTGTLIFLALYKIIIKKRASVK